MKQNAKIILLLVMTFVTAVSCQTNQSDDHGTETPQADEKTFPDYQHGVIQDQVDSLTPISLGIDDIYTTAFSSDGKYLAVSSDGIYLYDRETSELLWHDQLDDPLTTTAYQPQGAAFATGSKNGLIAIWPGQDIDFEFAYLAAHSDEITSLAFAPDGIILASASKDQSVKLWNLDGVTPYEDTPTKLQLETDVSMQQLTMHNSQVNTVSWSATGLLASADQNGDVIIWEGGMQGEASPIYLKQFEKPVIALAFHPENELLLVGLADGQIIPWNITENEILEPLGNPTSGLLAMAWSNDGTRLAYGYSSGIIEIINPYTGHEPMILEVQVEINDLAWSPDDYQLAVATNLGQLIVFDLRTSKVIAVSNKIPSTIKSLDWSLEKDLILVGTREGNLHLWDNSPHQHIYSISEEYSLWDALEGYFNSDGSLIAAISHHSGNIFILETVSGQLVSTLTELDFWVNGITWSSNSSHFAAIGRSDQFEGGSVKALIIWKTDTWQPFLSLTFGEYTSLSGITFNPEGDQVAAVVDNYVLVWNIATGEMLEAIEFPDADPGNCLIWLPEGAKRYSGFSFIGENKNLYNLECSEVRLSPDGNYIGTSNGNFVYINNAHTGVQLHRRIGSNWRHDGREGVAFTFGPNQQAVHIGGSGNLIFTNLISGLQTEYNIIENSPLESVSWAPHGVMIVGAYASGETYAFSPKYEFGESYLKQIYNHAPTILRFNQDNTRLATILSDGRVIVWDVLTGEMINILVGHSEPPDDIQFLADGRIVSISKARTIIWDIEQKSHQAFTNPTKLEDSAISPDGKLIASKTGTNRISIWEISANQEVASINSPSNTILALTWSPNGRYLAAGTGDMFHYGDTFVWEVTSEKTLVEYARFERFLVPFSFSPDSTKLAADFPRPPGIVVVELESREVISNLQKDLGFLWSLSWTADSEQILIGAWMGESYLWDFDQ